MSVLGDTVRWCWMDLMRPSGLTLSGSLFHQGTVYSATVAAVPFLVELAQRAPTRRGELAWLVGMLADPTMPTAVLSTQ